MVQQKDKKKILSQKTKALTTYFQISAYVR